jgi:hydrogenase maturation protease
MSNASSVVVIGLGNDYRSDDGAGLLAARRIRECMLPRVCVFEGVADGAALVEAWDGAGLAFVVDGVIGGKRLGTVYRFDAGCGKLPADMFTTWSSHVFDLVKTIEFAKTLGRLPAKLIVYGIEGRHFRPGVRLSDAVKYGIDEVVQRILKEIEASDEMSLLSDSNTN